jgi:DNA-3-methyladenine glycosylase II
LIPAGGEIFADDKLSAMQTIGTIKPVPPYRFDLTLDLISRFPHPTVDVAHDGAYWRVVRVGDGLALLRVRTGDDQLLHVDCAASTGPFDRTAALDAMRHILCTELDLRGFYAYARERPELWHVMQPIVGLRWLRTPSVYEALMTTIIEQQIAWKTAQRAQRWLVEWAANGLEHDGKRYYAFPKPALIARATVEELAPLKITFRRMSTMIDLSQQIASGVLALEQLALLPVQEAYDVLVSFRGIGHWTAAWTLQRVHGFTNIVGHNDVALQAAVNHYFYNGSGRIPEGQVQSTYTRYGEFAGLAAHHTILRWIVDRY